MAIRKFNKITGGLNLTQSSQIGDDDFVIAKNVFYNNAKQLQTRRGYKTFADQIWSSPITSFFGFQRDDNQERIAVCHAGNNLYALDTATNTWSSIASNKREFETLPERVSNRVRRDFAVYKNVIYMCNGVDHYCKYDGTTFSNIGVASGVTCTADSWTDKITKATHWLSDDDEVYLTSSGDMPGWLTAYQVYYVVNRDANTFQLSTTKGGDAIDLTSNWTWTIQYFELTEPRTRYIQYMQDRLFGAGDDANPNSLYYTASAPADGDDLNANTVVVGGDENGIINWLEEYSQLVCSFKSGRIYTVDVANSVVAPIDSQTGGYSDRTIHMVGNNMLYFNERGIDWLKKAFGISWTSGIESETYSEKVRDAMELVKERQYNANAWRYIKELNNYYVATDTNDDNIPDTLYVYNSMVGAWTQYVFPPIYDFGKFWDSNYAPQYLFASASGGQMYEFETWFSDAGANIECQIRTKPLDFNDPGMVKEFRFVTVTGYKARGNDINVIVYVDEDEVLAGQITDDNLDIQTGGALGVLTLWESPLGVTGGESEGLDLYPYTMKFPFFARGYNIQIDLQSSGVQWVFEKFAISVNWIANEYFSYNNIG